MRTLCIVAVLATGCGSSTSATDPDGGTGGGGDGGGGQGSGDHALGSCPVFPASTDGSRDSYAYWNADISGAPVDPMSDAYIASMNGGSVHVHPDFGSDPTYGIPFTTVPGTQPTVAMSFQVPDESDPGPYPFPPDAPIESGTDGHVLVVDRDHCVLYETGNSSYDPSTHTWSAFSGAKFDLQTGAPLRPETWTSADASGGPIFVGLARYEEATAGAIHHALRFTANRTSAAYIHPATHQAGSGTTAPPMGLRLRLKASACPGLLAGAGTAHPTAQVIVQALCTYGMILADNGSDFYISGTTDTRWNDDDLAFLKTIPGTDFEAIATGALRH